MSQPDPPPRLSVVVPALDEANRIGGAVSRLQAALDGPLAGSFELLVVDDGSGDDTAAVARAAGAQSLRLARNLGKGAAVRAGVLAARGELVAYVDADLAYPPDLLLDLVAALEAGADVAVGSRRHPDSVVASDGGMARTIGNRVFSGFVRATLGIAQRDPQCGLKGFRRSAAVRLFVDSRLDGFAFDGEVLLLARRFGLRVVEVPVRLEATTGSTVRLGHDALRMARDVLRVRAWAAAGAYSPATADGAGRSGDRSEPSAGPR